MGGACARCAEVTKADVAAGKVEEKQLEESEEETAESSSSDEEENERIVVEDTLVRLHKSLARGKTTALSDAISSAKKAGVGESVIIEAEFKLEGHQKIKVMEALFTEIEEFLTRTNLRLEAVDAMIAKLSEWEVEKDFVEPLMDKLQAKHAELWNQRLLEEKEVLFAREFLRQSCRELVIAAATEEGRAVTVLDLEWGTKTHGALIVDPPLQTLSVVLDNDYDDEGLAIQAPITSLSASPARDDKKVRGSFAFTNMDEAGCNCALAVRYKAKGGMGVLCFIEPSMLLRDRLLQAIVVLANVSK
eukprot:NODE_13216_length_1178_cov_5.984776.p1 GENE.NODE_13216_length_1178_cov_5.984776~~NODE_13216_length_1178_cov_5.984776.p1  ORF type:complete len:304 (-),score=82.18 NODE_13216_length_1178_cov_5.984776:192-1103(-)